MMCLQWEHSDIKLLLFSNETYVHACMMCAHGYCLGCNISEPHCYCFSNVRSLTEPHFKSPKMCTWVHTDARQDKKKLCVCNQNYKCVHMHAYWGWHISMHTV